MAKDGYIDLGQKISPMKPMEADKAPKVSYPTVFIRHQMSGDQAGLDELPDGEFEFTGRAKIVSYKENKKDGTCECEMELLAIKPDVKKAKKAKGADEGLDEALSKIQKGKMDTADEPEAEDNATEEADEGDMMD